MVAGTLLFVAGASPQIITETVSCLARESRVAGETIDVYVLTTTTGRQLIQRQLLNRGGQWSRLRQAYRGTRSFELTPRNVIVLRDARGAPLDDVRSPADNLAAANQIVRFVADHTGTDSPPLHASIAGGRKTMGYLLATAMMLYGRREDRLSHVLVHPPELEGTDFYFPPPRLAGMLTHHRPDGSAVRVRAANVHVDLADLPFLRLRGVKHMSTLRGVSFSEVVQRLQADLDILAQPRLTVAEERGALLCGDREVALPPVQLAVYALLAMRRRLSCGQSACPGCARCCLPAGEIRNVFRGELRERLQARQSAGVGPNWDERAFRSEVSKINRRLERVLRSASEPYRIQVTGPRRARLYGLRLNPGLISVGT